VVGAINHLISVKYSDAMQSAYDAVRPEVVAFMNRMSASQAVYVGMQQLRDSADGVALSSERVRILGQSLRAMERAGVHLQGEERTSYQQIKERLAELGNNFQTNLLKEEQIARVIVTDAEQLSGLPEAIVSMAAEQAQKDLAQDQGAAQNEGRNPAGLWHFVVNAVCYTAVIQHCSNRSLREEFYRAFRARGNGACSVAGEAAAVFNNRPVLEEILKLRQAQARLVGFDNYAELSIDSKMASSVNSVWALLEQLEAAARPAAEQEFAQLKLFMVEHDADGAASPEPWDLGYYSERLRESRYEYDAETIRNYLQLPRVLQGLFKLIKKLYRVDIVASDDLELPRWDESVQFFEVRRNGDLVAGFYVDPYARPGEKRGGAWMNTVVGRSRLLARPGLDSSLPVALFVMNARPPAAGKPGLMSLDEVRTLFHEFGHATQHMFTDIKEGGASGMNLVEWDAVELASQFNEYWMEYKPFLKELTAHVDTGKALDDTTLDRIIASRNFMVGNATLRQVLFAKVDMRMHQMCGFDKDSASPFAIERDLAAATVVLPMLDDESQLPAFGHLFAGGYAAGYYSYKWAEVLAADAFAAFREVGLDNEVGIQKVAERFKNTVLGLGGSLPAAEIYRLFRGRDATVDALLIDQGLVNRDTGNLGNL
jgi:oligopeptidase A